jgi:hypothetical protein
MALAVALIVLAALALAGAALMRAVDTTLAIAGNLGFREATIAPVNAAVEEAYAALYESGQIANREQPMAPQAYYAAREAGEDARGVPRALQRLPAESPVRTLDAGNGYTVRYLIERMCVAPGPPTAANCALVPPVSTAVPVDDPETAPPRVPVFRVSVRVDGPRGALTYAQAAIRDSTPPHRMAWRTLGE